MITAICPGSYDPVTNGHVDVIRRAATIFDRVVVGVVRDPAHKQTLFTVEELRSANVSIALYPLSAFRAMNKAALKVYETVRKQGTQKPVVGDMQTRDELYDYLNYHAYEQKLDELFSSRR